MEKLKNMKVAKHLSYLEQDKEYKLVIISTQVALNQNRNKIINSQNKVLLNQKRNKIINSQIIHHKNKIRENKSLLSV